MDAGDFVRQMQALLPPGKAWSTSLLSLITKTLEGAAPEFARIQARADKLLLELNPITAEELLPEWEFQYGLPDECAPPASSTEARQAALAARALQRAGHNGADYEAIAVALGYPEADVVDHPYKPFCAGKSAAGEPLCSEPWVYVLFVGYMENLIADPNDFTAGWMRPEPIDVTEDIGRAPDGALTADRLTFNATGAEMTYEVTDDAAPAAETEFSVWLKSESGLVDLELAVSSGLDEGTVQVKADTVWQRFKMRFQATASTYGATIRFTGTAPASVLAWGASTATVDPALECRLRHTVQAHGLAEFGRTDEFFPLAPIEITPVLIVDALGNRLVDHEGFLLA